MSIEQLIKENTEALKALTAAIKSGAGPVAKTPDETPKVAEKAQPKKQSEPKPEAPAAESKTELSYADVSGAILALQKAKGTPVAKEVLAQFGVPNATKLTKDQWAAFIAACEGAMV